jgi:hypothetical protein
MKIRLLMGAYAIPALLLAVPVQAAGLWSTLPAPVIPMSGAETLPCDTNLANGVPPQTEICTIQQLRGVTYQQSTPVTGFSIAAASATNIVQITPAGTLAAGTVTTPPAPVDGQRFKIFTTQTITALTVTASPGQTINTTVTTLAANAGVEWVYEASNSTWYRIS